MNAPQFPPLLVGQDATAVHYRLRWPRAVADQGFTPSSMISSQISCGRPRLCARCKAIRGGRVLDLRVAQNALGVLPRRQRLEYTWDVDGTVYVNGGRCGALRAGGVHRRLSRIGWWST
jgi:hypothetical protein